MAEGIVNLTSATWDQEVTEYKGIVMVDFLGRMVWSLQDGRPHY